MKDVILSMSAVILSITAVPAWASLTVGLIAFGLGVSPELIVRGMALASGVSVLFVGIAVLQASAEATAQMDDRPRLEAVDDKAR